MARMLLRRIEPLEGVDLNQHRSSNFARLDDTLDPCNQRVKVPIVCDPQLDAICPASCNHLVAFFYIHRHRFFTEHMLPRLSGGDSLNGMQVDGCGYVDRFDFSIGEQIITSAIRFCCAELIG